MSPTKNLQAGTSFFAGFFAGFSVRLIAVLMKETEDAIYQKRHRLRKYLEASDLAHKELFLVLLDK